MKTKKLQLIIKASILCLFLVGMSLQSCLKHSNDSEKKDYNTVAVTGELTAELSSPPNVPAPIGDRDPKRLIVNLEVKELEGEMTDGVRYTYWTFGGTVPGSFIRTRVGDIVEFTLNNHPDNKLPHNIDLHAVTGPGGGATSSFVAPGQQKTFSFRVLNPGLYVYHCATAPVGMHVANGMYGLILVEPEGGLPKVDKEYYVMQGDFYTKGKYGDAGLQPFDMQKAIDEKPDYVVFNGKVGALTNDHALTAKVGETVRLFVGNGGPNMVSSFHVIGEIFDNVNIEGGSTLNHNVQTTLIPAGGAAIVEFKVDVPGNFILVDHSIFRAFNKGALAILKVEGDEDKNIYSGELRHGIYLPEGGTIQEMVVDEADQDNGTKTAKTKDERIAEGKTLYMQSCFACHQSEGQGIPNAFPPLAKSDYLNADAERTIGIVLKGLSGEITVNGQKFNSSMPAQQYSDDQVASVLTFVYNSWGNSGKEISPEMVKNKRGK